MRSISIELQTGVWEDDEIILESNGMVGMDAEIFLSVCSKNRLLSRNQGVF